MKNTYLLFLYSLVLLATISSCMNSKPRFRIGVSQCSDDAWRHQMNREIRREALFYDGVKVEIRTAADNNIRQAEDIRYFIKENVDLLVVAPNEAAPITPIVEEAYQRGIPIIIIDRKILSDKYTAYIGADNYEIGKEVGNYIANLLQGKGTVVELTGLAGSTPAMDRHQGFLFAISAYPKIRLLSHVDAGWFRDVAKQKMNTLLDNFPQIDVVYAQNDRMAAGAYDAAIEKKRTKNICFIGTDALPEKGLGLDLVLEKKLNATFVYPTGGDRVIQIAMDILKKRPFPRKTLLKTSVVDITNAPIMRMQTTHIATLDKKIEMLRGKINEYLDRYANQQIVLYGSLLVLFLVIGLLVAVYSSLRTKSRLNSELSQQKNRLEQQKTLLEQQKDQLEQLSHELEKATHAKLAFFTNVSHEFRTPLTLIADPINQLLGNSSLDKNSRNLLDLMKKNVCILLRLVNQILDFRKVENERMELHLEPFNMLQSFRNWNDSFRMALLKKHISFHFDSTPDVDFYLMADIEKMERIYFNLLYNAVKYTPENGKITVKLEIQENQDKDKIITDDKDRLYFRFSVFNSGSYISPQEVEAIFERFYQVEQHQAGTGIGLALVYAFVKMHQGYINVHSNEKGTIFIIYFPVHPIQNPSSAIIRIVDKEETFSTLSDEGLPDDVEIEGPDQPRVLVIDDNADIRRYVKTLLVNKYRVLQAHNATLGIRLALKYIPDVIVLDVMMPGMDGIECCNHLKNEMQTCHIPVILLTACSLDEQRIKGYDGGADSYISKPFNSQLLLSRICNLITSRKRLKQFWGDNSTLAQENICDIDKEFILRFKTLLEKRMKDANLNVENLSKEMNLSRVQLYRKIKFLTNYSPNELLRKTRLKRAAYMLASSEITISEIAYEVGFSSPSYFTKCYKEEFGESPIDLVKRKKAETPNISK